MIKSFLKVSLVILISFLGYSNVFAQYLIRADISGMQSNRAFLLEYKGMENPLIDSIRTLTPGQLEFTLPQDAHPGMYRIVFGPRSFLDFVFNKEDVYLKTEFNAPIESLEVVKSKENKLWSEYMHFNLNLGQKQDYLQRLMSLYNEDEPFYQEIEKEMAAIGQTDRESVSRKIIDQYPESLVARYLKTEIAIQVPVGLSIEEEMDYVLENFFAEVNFDDADLQFSPHLMTLVNAYFSQYQRAYKPDEVEEAMIVGLNRLLSLAAINDDVFTFLLDQLRNMFEQSEFESLFAYLTENFLLDSSCKDENSSKELEEILAAINKTKVGKTAPEIIVLKDGKSGTLFSKENRVTLVLFWASWCPHCNEILPDIKSLYTKYKDKGFEIIAISIDKEKIDYEAALQKGDIPWINHSELKGWDCSIAQDYGIRATPTMILVDQNRTIIAKPNRIEDLTYRLQNLFR